MTTIAIAGGTGWVGRRVVDSVRRLGAEPSIIARSRGVDLTTGDGLDAALAGADVVIDVTNIVTQNRLRATTFCETSTRHLLGAEERDGASTTCCCRSSESTVSVWATTRPSSPRRSSCGKGGIPWTILRATQFHEFAAQMLGDGPVAMVPSMLSQPVAARDVADELVRLAAAPAAGMAPGLA